MSITTIAVRAKPGARMEGLTRAADGALIARVTAPAEGGKANAAIEALIARTLGVPRRAVQIVSGAGGRSKRVAIEYGDLRAITAALARIPPG